MCSIVLKYYDIKYVTFLFSLFQYCVATVIPDLLLVWGGSTDPCGTATLMSIGKLGVEENKKHAAVLYDHIEKNLGIPRNR